jgi:small subunit ribosomal protein S9
MADSSVTHAVGRRKEAVCRVYIRPGSGKWDVNGRTLGDYFPRAALVSAIQQPFTATDTLGRFDVRANVDGGGQTGQAGALRLAVARALVSIDESHRRKLRAQEAGTSEGTKEVPVLEALTRFESRERSVVSDSQLRATDVRRTTLDILHVIRAASGAGSPVERRR